MIKQQQEACAAIIASKARRWRIVICGRAAPPLRWEMKTPWLLTRAEAVVNPLCRTASLTNCAATSKTRTTSMSRRGRIAALDSKQGAPLRFRFHWQLFRRG